MKKTIGAILILICSGPTFAQEVDCSEDAQVNQMQMNHCSYLAYQLADEDLNLAYGLARDALRQADEGVLEIYGEKPVGYKDGVTTLRDAQLAWITFRDLTCEAEGNMYYGGSIRPLIENSCKEQLTRVRTEELRRAFEQN